MMKLFIKLFLLGIFYLSGIAAEVLVPFKSDWKYYKGTAEASVPNNAWRELNFDDSTWSSGPAPIYYGENIVDGTRITDMRSNYMTIFLRTTFLATNVAEMDRLALRAEIDDGFIAWINGTEVARFNVTGSQPFNGRAAGTINRTWVTNSLSNLSSLREGANVLAIHLLNSTLTSSDILLDLQLESTSDRTPPVITSISPPPGTVGVLTRITVQFSEPVQGVSADDLLINNQPATSVTASGNSYTFNFPQPELGIIDITWEAGHFIEDLANPPHPFDSTAPGATWQYNLSDDIPPSILIITPPANTTVRSLSQVELKFNEPLVGIEAADLLVNGVTATDLQIRAGNIYVFQFPPAAPGQVMLSWVSSHQISDVAGNPFTPGTWSYTVNPNLPIASVVISEFLAAAEASTGLKDEDGELQDWIELHNTSGSPVNLAGWSLTDDPEDPDLWVFPSVTLAANARLVVFASAKDRRPTTTGSRLHTNFKLSSDGEYLGLFNSDSPRIPMSEFIGGYPFQRNDYSYGLNAQGSWNYFQVPTPGQPNGSTTILGALPKPIVSVERGTYEVPFDLTITCDISDATIRYTVDGSQPTASNGQIYSSPLNISKTTVLRVAAFRENYIPSETGTHTYIFLDQVLVQPNEPPGFPVGPTVMAGYPSDYEMDPEIVNDPAYSGQMKAALASLPILSVAIKTDDMFGANNGIYTHPTSRGAAWERACSIEFMPQDGNDFQVNAGIQVQGNAARDPQKNPKHPFRLVFKGDYGPSQLNYRIFPDSPIDSFDTLILRADFNYSWLHWNPSQRIRAQRTRDSWMKDSMRAMGGISSHNRYFHLYINGLYWGVYDFTERPDGAMAASYYGGEKEDYDVMNEGAAVDGTRASYDTMIGFTNLGDLSQYNAIKQYLDMTQFIDYMLLHFYVGHEDWFNNKNWYAFRPKDGSSGYKYLPWDGEMVMGEPGVNKVSASDLPSGLHPKLIANAQYKLDFADRVHKHFFNAGALTPQANSARWMKRAREVELPIIAESARWGDYRRDVHQFSSAPYELYERDAQWRAEQARLTGTYFPNRSATVLNQLRNAGLYPSLAAPVFNQHGGKIDPGFQLTMTAPVGTIYYTTNGVDPRVYGVGTVAPEAKPYSSALTLNASAQVKARVYNAGSWSALNEALFDADGPRFPLRITEIMYNPDPPGDEYEFIELQNFSALPLDVSYYSIEGVDFIFPPQTILAPGEIIILGSGAIRSSFANRYPNLQVFSTFEGELVNRGERLALLTADDQVIFSVDYDDEKGWPKAADGDGYSLEIIDPFGDPDDPANWHATTLNGSPGESNAEPPQRAVIINEISAASAVDWIEIHNNSATDVNLSDWRLQEAGNTNVFVFPPGTTLQSSQFLIVYFDRLTNSPGLHASFGLDQDGETLILVNSAGKTMDLLTFGPQAESFTLGLIGTSLELSEPTPGSANTQAQLGSPASLFINEWLANAPQGMSDWLEIHNSDATRPVSVRGLFLSVTNQFFEITSHTFIAPGGHILFLADEQPGPDHIDFKLPAAGATLALLDNAGNLIDEITYGIQTESNSEGRYPDSTSNIVTFPYSPTPRAQNALTFPLSSSLDQSGVTLSWPSVQGRSYKVEFANELPASSWSLLTQVDATNSISGINDSPQGVQRYYRVVVVP